VDVLYFILVAGASAMMLLSGSYLYGRFRENPRAQTLTLSISLLLFGVTLVLDDVLLMQPAVVPEWFEVTLSITLVSAGFLFLSAVYALELRRAARLPALAVIPFTFLELTLGSGMPWITLVTAALLLVFAILPICMFGAAWRRLRATGRRGAGRPLGLLVGLLLLTVSDLLMFAFPLMSGILQVIGAAVLLLAVTGSIDRWFYKQVP
jgi:uncharacterized membrane protein YfhO